MLDDRQKFQKGISEQKSFSLYSAEKFKKDMTMEIFFKVSAQCV